ncbi:hypothetical protein Ddc_14074 [Ditylenchus destructor]|nr:hypothetical protein Ddc_14074 [Ditylenchus destructor]
MSCSKPLPPFICDSLYYLNRDQLERFSIVCRPFKNFIDRYLHTKPYRVFDNLSICGGSYALYNCYTLYNNVHWHPNRDDYSVQQFLAGEALQPEYYKHCEYYKHYSFGEMRPYLGQNVRIKNTVISLGDDITYNPEHIEQMESIAHLWCDRKIDVWKWDGIGIICVLNDFQLILDSPTILQCRHLSMGYAHFSFKDYRVLYNAKIIENYYGNEETDPNYWPQFLDQPGVKPLVVLRYFSRKNINALIDHLSKTFSSAVLPNAFKIVFTETSDPLIEFRKTNNASAEKLELKRGLPTEYQDDDNKFLDRYINYTLERSSI